MSFDFNMVWPLILAILLAIYSILTRNISAYDNSETSFFWVAMVGGVVMTIIGPFFFELLVLKDIPWFLFLCFLSTCGHFLFIKALETAQASILQPFIYLQLFFASIIGILVFNDLLTLNLIIRKKMDLLLSLQLPLLWLPKKSLFQNYHKQKYYELKLSK